MPCPGRRAAMDGRPPAFSLQPGREEEIDRQRRATHGQQLGTRPRPVRIGT